MRLIDADALMARYGEPCHSFADIIEDMPTIDAVQVITNGQDTTYLRAKSIDDLRGRLIIEEDAGNRCAVYYEDTDDVVPVVRCINCKHLCMPLIMCDIGGIYAPIPYDLKKHFCSLGDPRT